MSVRMRNELLDEGVARHGPRKVLTGHERRARGLAEMLRPRDGVRTVRRTTVAADGSRPALKRAWDRVT